MTISNAKRNWLPPDFSWFCNLTSLLLIFGEIEIVKAETNQRNSSEKSDKSKELQTKSNMGSPGIWPPAKTTPFRHEDRSKIGEIGLPNHFFFFDGFYVKSEGEAVFCIATTLYSVLLYFLLIFFPSRIKFIASEELTLWKRWVSDYTIFGSSLRIRATVNCYQ